MDRQLEGKVAIVTGGTQGLGEAIARLFVARGAAGILLVGRDRERGRKVADALEAEGARALFVQADLSELDAVRRIVPACEGAFGRVDCLVNAAALTDRGNVVNTSPELFDRLVAVNVRAPFFLMQDAIRLMLDQKIEGAIVNILSTSAHGGQSFLTVYSATKTMLGALTKNVAFSVLPHRIRVNGLNIGWMNTYQAMIVPFLFTPFGIFMMRQFMLNIPSDYIDAARIDGAGEIKIIYSVIFPLIREAAAALAIFVFIAHWNELFWALLMLRQRHMFTLPLALFVIQGDYGTFYHLVLAGATLAIIPPLIVYALFQEHIVRGITLTGLKG